MEKENIRPSNEEEEEYLGNIWGWKFSFISLGIILFFLAFMVYRHLTLDPEKVPDIPEGKTQTDSFSTDTFGN